MLWVIEKIDGVQIRTKAWVQSLLCQWNCLLFYRIKATFLSLGVLKHLYHLPPTYGTNSEGALPICSVANHIHEFIFLFLSLCTCFPFIWIALLFSQNSHLNIHFLQKATLAPGSTLTNSKKFKAEKNLWDYLVINLHFIDKTEAQKDQVTCAYLQSQ